MDSCIENVIEFLKDHNQATVTFSQGRYKSVLRKLAKARPEECQIVTENSDGSICARIPVKWIKISPPKEMSERQREVSRRNIQKCLRSANENRQNGAKTL